MWTVGAGRLVLRSREGQGELVRVVCGTGTKRVNKSLSYLGILATLCFSIVGMSTNGPGSGLQSHFVLDGKRYIRTLCIALRSEKFVTGNVLSALKRCNSVLSKRPAVKIPNVRIGAKTLKRNLSIKINVTVTTGVSGEGCGACILVKSNRRNRNSVCRTTVTTQRCGLSGLMTMVSHGRLRVDKSARSIVKVSSVHSH